MKPLLCAWLASVLLVSAPAAVRAWENSLRWNSGLQWQVRATVQHADGRWSAPVSWRFTVAAEDAQTAVIAVEGGGGSSARLTVDTVRGQLANVWLADRLRGETVGREMRIQGASPIYPYLTAIPLFFPRMGSVVGEETFSLKRTLNGRSIPVETLRQEVGPLSGSQPPSDLPDEARRAWEAIVGDSDLVRYAVYKGDRWLFTQYWSEEAPWAVYTHSNTCKAWLVK